jgi:hypothetical protein
MARNDENANVPALQQCQNVQQKGDLLMKGLRHSLAAAVLLSAAVAAAQTARPARQYTIDQFLTTTAISGASFSADETRILFSSNKSGIWNALHDSGHRR